MVAELLFLAGFTLFPTVALSAGVGYSLREAYIIGETRVAIVVLVLGFMLFHQTGELAHFLQTGAFGSPVAGEVFETSANLVAVGPVYYVLSYLRNERELRRARWVTAAVSHVRRIPRRNASVCLRRLSPPRRGSCRVPTASRPRGPG